MVQQEVNALTKDGAANAGHLPGDVSTTSVMYQML